MIIDCDRCVMQHTTACDDCVVGALMRIPGPLTLADAEAKALEALSEAGLVSPLRLIEREGEPETAAG